MRGVVLQNAQFENGTFPGSRPARLEVDEDQVEEFFFDYRHRFRDEVRLHFDHSREFWSPMNLAPKLTMLLRKCLVVSPAPSQNIAPQG